ncbi:hypothetical protein [Pseudoduganella sp. RAF53_2]|uniref:hypothetical protein n=1 Tax=unclassified Pseudoduganella TaxID=2637179 RepID=UPI003F943FB0
MDRKLRLTLASAFADQMRASLPEFKLWNVTAPSLMDGELVWKNGNSLIILSPDSRGLRDAVTVELGWSEQGAFPQHQRPSLISQAQLDDVHLQPEWTVRLGRLDNNNFDNIEISMTSCEEVAAFLMDRLQSVGLPFFMRMGSELVY